MPSEGKEDDKPKSRLRPRVILLNASKREAFSPNAGFKRLFRRLRSSNYKPVNNRDDITAKLLELRMVVKLIDELSLNWCQITKWKEIRVNK